MAIADIKWPGPRPLAFPLDSDTEAPLQMLVGRGEELDELRLALQSYSVVEITAPSGVGKTSFVSAAVPYLWDAGAKVRRGRSWSDTLHEFDALASPDVAALYCLALGHAPVAEPDLPTLLNALAGDDVLVCVLDQCEELLRYRLPLGRQLLGLVGRVARDAKTPHLVIARSEFRDELRYVEVQRTPVWHIFLKEIADPAVIREIIDGPAREQHVEINAEALDRVVAWWQSAREAYGASSIDGAMSRAGAVHFGLLHLQALLWSFRDWARLDVEVSPDRVTDADLARYAATRGVDADPQHGVAMLESAMRSYIENTIGGCRDERWPYGPQLMLARAARHLSSAGFKVPQAASSLVPLALQEELASSADAREITRLLRDDENPLAAVAHAFPIEGAGTAANWDEERVTRVMVGSLMRGLDHLADDERANVLRKFEHSRDAVYELVHDGVGPALNAWASDVLDSPVSILRSISARNGLPMKHDLGPQTFPADVVGEEWDGPRVGAGGRHVLRNLKWIGNRVARIDRDSADPDNPEKAAALRERGGLLLERLVFENCEFRGSVFIGVTFRDVEFVNCGLQGVAMLCCAFENVRFEGTAYLGALDTLTIWNAWPGPEIKFSGTEVQGLFVTAVHGGRWTFENVAIQHLVFRSPSGRSLQLRFSAPSDLRHVTLDVDTAATTLQLDDGVVIYPRTDNGFLGERALPTS